MAISLEEYRRLKAKVDAKKTAADKAEGAYDEAMKRLLAMGFTSLDHAKQSLDGMKKELVSASEQYSSAVAAFKQKWGEKLE